MDEAIEATRHQMDNYLPKPATMADALRDAQEQALAAIAHLAKTGQ